MQDTTKHSGEQAAREQLFVAAKETLCGFLNPGVKFDDLFPKGECWPQPREMLHTHEISGQIYLAYDGCRRLIEAERLEEAEDAARLVCFIAEQYKARK